MLFADTESMSKTVDEPYRKKMDQIKTEREKEQGIIYRKD